MSRLAAVAVIAWIVTPALGWKERLPTVLAAVVISAASPMAISEVGTTFSDLLTSILVLGGLALLMRAEFQPGRAVSTSMWIVLAGALVGAAVSLKLTNAAFAIGLFAAAMVGWRSWSERLTAIAATCAGGCLGFALCGGFWYLRMWRTFGNPFFPYYNAIFRSPDYPSTASVFDGRYLPHSLLEALSYPFRWAIGGQATAELSSRDIRFAVLIVAGLVAFSARLARGPDASVQWTPAGRRLVIFFLVAFCVWMYEWSIQRYIVMLELLLGPVLVLVLQEFRSGRFGREFFPPLRSRYTSRCMRSYDKIARLGPHSLGQDLVFRKCSADRRRSSNRISRRPTTVLSCVRAPARIDGGRGHCVGRPFRWGQRISSSDQTSIGRPGE